MSVVLAVIVFLGCTLVILLLGTRLAMLADRLADRTGLGEAFVGAVFLGAATSLPGITASVTAAAGGHAAMALSNAIWGIAAQTAFLGVADLVYRKANLEHAAASSSNNMQGALLLILLAMIILGMAGPDVSAWGVHPITVALPVVYVYGLRLVWDGRAHPMWQPSQTDDTETDTADEPRRRPRANTGMWLRFIGASAGVIAAGYGVTQATLVLGAAWGFNATVAGAVFTAIATSLPELVTSIAAVRRGALTLAVGGIIGGNCFDTLFAAMADVAYREGSIYHAALAVSTRELALIAAAMVMTATLVLGLLRRQKRGPAGIGFESLAVLIGYLGVMAMLGWF